MKPIRVLHVIDSLHLGGAQEVVLQLALNTHRERFEHEVATLHGRGVYWDRMADQKIPLHSLSPNKLIPLYVPRLVGLLRSGRYSVLHCHLGASNLMGKPLGRWCKIPGILSHDHTNDAARANNPLVLALDRWSNQYADAFVAVSGTCRDFLIQREGISPQKITVIPNAVDTRWFAPGTPNRNAAREALGVDNEALIVSGVGRLRPQKNFQLFLEIAAALAGDFPGTRFLLAGTGPEEKLLRKQAAEAGLDRQVTFCGYVADTRLVYAASDVLLMPSRFEGLPMTLLEAMASGLPVVASELDGIAEVIEGGKEGFLCEPGKLKPFAKAVGNLLNDAALREKIGSAARKKIEEHYSVGTMVSGVESIYEELVG